MAHQPEFVRYEATDGVGTITLDRPPLNAYDPLLHFELEQAWAAGARDADARVLVLRAMGKHFCAGALLDGSPRAAPADAEPMSEWDELEFVRDLAKPTIAAVQGGCIGGAQRFVFPCDLIFCSEDAFFRDPLVAVGGIGGIQAPIHTWLYGPRLAKEMLFSGMRLPASRLYAMGAVNRLYPPDTLHDETARFAREIAQADPLALRQAKRAVNTTMDIQGQHYIRNRFAELMDASPRLDLGRA
ncbi:MAG TPA: enoyl-CoA hydratase-related protein [Acidimicrobiia bacterium]|nr:enoyl-CoA hydratase-related protein [Acidimicrobiia bacterium]